LIKPVSNTTMSQINYFPGIPDKIPFEGPESRNPLAFKYYNPDEVVAGKKMRDHLRFAVCYWHTWTGFGRDIFGEETATRPESWRHGNTPLEQALSQVRAHFQFLDKLGVDFYTFHDRDISPLGKDLEETNKNLDQVVALCKQLQKETGKKLLWGTANLFSHRRFMNGGATNPDSHVFAMAAAQVKKAMDITHELGGENYVFWGGREGYQTLMNTDLRKELDHYAQFLRMAADYKKKIGFKGTLLIEPKPREPMKHQYDFDVATTLNFLRTYGLENEFKVNIECNHATLSGHSFEHEVRLASVYGALGSIDANDGDMLVGWDLDRFNTDVYNTTAVMKVILETPGGLGTGGLNFDAKVRRESTDVEDLFIGHISSMDAFAKGLKIAAKIKEEGILDRLVAERYKSWNDELGQKIESGKATLEELEQYALKHGEPTQYSAKQEKFESIYATYL
jgi:xylose isomerase